MKKFISHIIILICLGYTESVWAQKSTSNLMSDSTFIGLKLRSLGPGFMSGRIADIAIHPQDDNLWYVAVGSGGVWKTKNAGVTWTPIFDDQTSYSIGCVIVDPQNPYVVWVGTGENIGGRHAGYGDGIYRSDDGGANWKNMGLKNSQHISEIVIHPENSNILWVAAQGPLWSKGGDRGLYKSINGGQTWKKVLGDNEWVGVTDIAIDPRNPDWMYAATWQRHRSVAAYLGGGPGSGIHRSTDGGETWEKLTEGLPKSSMGKIGLAIAPQQPDIVYAAIELDRRTGGVFRSTDRGSTWEKRSDAVAGATGPHYYQELYASPHQFGRLYLVDSRMQVSDDGGKTFRGLNRKDKHGDNHAIAFREDDPDYLLVGTDGGVYESFDLGDNWRFMANLPLTQYYKVAVDDAEPFYNIYGGTQDNSTQGGPSRTDNVHGIQNADWKIVLNWDGHQPATEPGNPNILYAERQEGNLSRVDLITGEVVDIQPQPGQGENYERFNWDSPILVSPHLPTRIYFASQRLWRSDNRGDSWTAISGDLTRNQERIALPIMGSTQSWDNAWDFLAMSNYNTITSISESPLQEGLIYVGTDDGIIQVTENGGTNWRKIEAGSLPGVPSTAFVNDIKADLHNANTVYVVLDNHKFGDFNPYLLKSIDRGKNWRSIKGNIPNRTLVWRVVQDHIKSELMFAATEFGIYFTINGGGKWVKLLGGVPTISFRDLAIQKRENDLIGASFGRGFYVFDDYSILREVSEQQLQQEATLFSTRNAWWYIPRPQLSFGDEKGSQGTSYYMAPNPPFGAVFTYYLKDGLKSKKTTRQEREKELVKQNRNVSFPGWEAVEAERRQDSVRIWLTVKDNNGKVVRRVPGVVEKGFQQVAWDLRYPAPDAIDLEKKPDPSGDHDPPQGFLAPPGTYTVTLSKQVDGVVTELSQPQTFEVVPLRKGALTGASTEVTATFWREHENAVRGYSAVKIALKNAITKITGMQEALSKTTSNPGDLDTRLHQLRLDLLDLDGQLNGNRSKLEPGEKTKPLIGERLFAVKRGIERSTYGPTETNKQSMQIIQQEMSEIHSKLEAYLSAMADLGKALLEAGAPWVEGERLPPGN
ncbi:MAG: glycosyl hydrolase [Bacteroidetes bacterium]|nr:glycosyl hydrolase [Bacteroidota bacterium]